MSDGGKFNDTRARRRRRNSLAGIGLQLDKLVVAEPVGRLRALPARGCTWST